MCVQGNETFPQIRSLTIRSREISSALVVTYAYLHPTIVIKLAMLDAARVCAAIQRSEEPFVFNDKQNTAVTKLKH